MPVPAYLTLKLARELFQSTPDALAPDQRQRVDRAAVRQLEIEDRILGTPEAAAVVLPAATVERGLREIRSRYSSDEEFHADLARSGLSEADLAAAVERDQKVEAILERVAGRGPGVNETDVEIFYLLHRSRFRRPETRTLRHILVTVNEDGPDSDRVAVRDRVEGIRQSLLQAPERFAEQALRHSECPTAMNGGLLGTLTRGQLYPELEPAAFALAPGELSAVVESPMGFHILHCVAAEDASDLPLASVRGRIREHLVASRRRAAHKGWIAGLLGRQS